MSNIAEPKRTPDEVNFLNPLVWAYVGDSVYELFIRTNLVNNSNEKVHKLHVSAIKFVKAAGQAKILKAIEEELTEEEKKYSSKSKKHTKPSYSKKCYTSRICICNSIRRTNWVFILNKARREIKIYIK